MSLIGGMGPLVLALATQAPAAPAATPKPDVAAAVARAAAQVSDFEEDAAQKAMAELVARTDLTPSERAQAELWRGVAALSQVKEDEARLAFSVARACQPDLAPPATVSPKIHEFFQKTAPGRCGNAQTLAAEDAAAARRTSAPAAPAARGEQERGGPNVMLLAGAGLGAAGGGVAVLAGLAVVGALVLVSLSFPVVAAAQAQQSARDVYRLAYVALGMRGGGLGAGLLGAVLLMGSVALGVGAAGLLALGVMR